MNLPLIQAKVNQFCQEVEATSHLMSVEKEREKTVGRPEDEGDLQVQSIDGFVPSV